ncbi:hypothetical protein [Nocardioides sp.]|uniref:hypothetical protein n=1 Tax=Nocardioides sp. TaxID=35761 RepID=UPI0019C31EBE|nr:hypothetical protein [Nocardioides sp.]MBC7277447.1 hypothetical protein [Nocardioides sp.]
MLADIELIHILAAAVAASGLYALVVATTTAVKTRRLARNSHPDAAYAALCASRGWTYTSKGRSAPTRFQLMPTEEESALPAGPQAINVVTGTHTARPFLSYEHRSWSRKPLTALAGPTLHRYRSEHLHLVGIDLGHLHPWLLVRPKASTGRGSQLLSRTEDSFEHAYSVETTRKTFATAVLHDEMRDHLLRNPARYQFDGTWVLMVVDGPARPEDVEPRLATLTAFLDLVPDHLLNRY